jgi:hypothetical protein
MVGDAVRDKMPLQPLLICELWQRKHRLQRVIAMMENGFYREYLVSLTKKGIEGYKK